MLRERQSVCFQCLFLALRKSTQREAEYGAHIFFGIFGEPSWVFVSSFSISHGTNKWWWILLRFRGDVFITTSPHYENALYVRVCLCDIILIHTASRTEHTGRRFAADNVQHFFILDQFFVALAVKRYTKKARKDQTADLSF